jgi:hypothetical protein
VAVAANWPRAVTDIWMDAGRMDPRYSSGSDEVRMEHDGIRNTPANVLGRNPEPNALRPARQSA